MRWMKRFSFMIVLASIFLMGGFLQAREEGFDPNRGSSLVSTKQYAPPSQIPNTNNSNYYVPRNSGNPTVSPAKANQKGFWFKTPNAAPYGDGGIYIPKN